MASANAAATATMTSARGGGPAASRAAVRGSPVRALGRPARAARGAVLMLGDEVAHHRIHRLAPAPAREDAVVTGTLRAVMELPVAGDARAQLVRSAGLARARDVVELAFDGEQRGAGDVLRPHQLAIDF